MSQHTFASTYNGRPVRVQIGWDAPLGHYFMVVTDASGLVPSAETGAIYSNLGDPAIDGGAGDPSYYWRKLDALGIVCTRRDLIDVEIRKDAIGEDGNRRFRY